MEEELIANIVVTSASSICMHSESIDKSDSTLQALPGKCNIDISPGYYHKHPWVSTRKYYHEDSSYIMDAKTRGNVGRYINVCCTSV